MKSERKLMKKRGRIFERLCYEKRIKENGKVRQDIKKNEKEEMKIKLDVQEKNGIES